MTITQDSASAHPSTDAGDIAPRALRPSARADRALALYVEHFDEIAASFRAGVYKVPSCTGAAVYTVRLVPEAYCSCPDARGGECKHVLAVRVVRKRTAPCASCGRRFRHRELIEVQEDHESLTWFPGDLLRPRVRRRPRGPVSFAVCRKYQRHCGAYLALQDSATEEWAAAETLTDVRTAWGRLGGLVTLHRYGQEHFRELGRRSGVSRHRRRSV